VSAIPESTPVRWAPPAAQVALAWILAQPGITCAILGASRPEQLNDSLPAVDLALDAQERRACDDVWFTLPRERASRAPV